MRCLRVCRRAVAASIATFGLLAAQPLVAQSIGYFNERFGFSLALPGNVFVAGQPRNPEAGGLWESRDGKARLIAVASENKARETLHNYRRFLMEEIYKGAEFDYAPLRDSWFVLSGRMDDLMFYERITFVCGGRFIYGWQMHYPVSERQSYDRIVEAIHKSYRAGRGEDGRCSK